MAERDQSGQDPNSGVDDGGNDAFASAFEAFAAGKTPPGDDPAPKDDEADLGDDEAGQDGAEREANASPSQGDETDPPADASGDEPAAGEEAPDPWANASPAQIAARDKMAEELNRLRASDEGSRRRASGLQRQLNALQRTAAAQPQTEQPGAEKERTDAQAALDEEIANLERDYPEVAGPLIRVLKAQRAELDELKGQVAPVAEANQQEVIAEQIRTLEATHKDWRNYGIADTPQYLGWLQSQPEEVRKENENFRGWLSAQPAKVQELADSEDAREVGVALSLYKTERAAAIRNAGGGDKPGTDATDARRQKQLDAGRAVGSRPGSAASGAPDDFAGAFEHFSRKKAGK
ncbi:MAG TPA: hypothetical protein VD768_06230 [Sphingomicrobium sp.]|nr:hypothetical protein [Sphingomicrobium sp.]